MKDKIIESILIGERSLCVVDQKDDSFYRDCRNLLCKRFDSHSADEFMKADYVLKNRLFIVTVSEFSKGQEHDFCKAIRSICLIKKVNNIFINSGIISGLERESKFKIHRGINGFINLKNIQLIGE